MKKTNIVWAFDVLDGSTEALKAQKKAAQYLSLLSRENKKLKISPLSLLPLGTMGFHDYLSSKEILDYQNDYTEIAQKKINKTSLKGEKVLVHTVKEKSSKDLIAQFTHHAQKLNVDFVALAAHHRTASERFFLGSFVEKFLYYSPLPGIIIPPNTPIPKNGIRKAMICLDSKDIILSSVEQTLEKLSSLGFEEVGLYHCIPFHKAHYYHRDFIDKLISERSQKLDQLAESVEKLKFKVKTHLSSGELDIPSDIVTLSKKQKYHLVCVRPKTGKLKSAFIGSVAKGVIRSSDIPCLV